MFNRSFNLQDMCLTVVIRDVDFFVYNKTIPQKHIDFLLRVYSEEVFKKQRNFKRFLSEDCMLWFLNPHVKKVTLPMFHSERVLTQLKMIGSGITSLNLHKSKATENELNFIICHIPHVVHLDLSETSCSDEILTCIQKSCPDLESLNVSCCDKVTDSGMENLCNGKLALKNLNVLYSDVEAFGVIKILNEMPSLECVKYDDLAGLLYEVASQKQYNLTELVYDDVLDSAAKVIKTWVKMCPKLKKLHFKYPVDEKVLKACARFKNLEELKIKMSHKYYVNIRVNDVLTPILPLSKNLKTLILSCLKISTTALIECFKNLENLYLKKVSFTPFKKEDIKSTKTNLSTLFINDVDIHDNVTNYEGVALLISLSKSVTKLHLNHIKPLPLQIFDTILKSMKNLTSVNFRFTGVEMDSLDPFFEIPSMTTVIASNIDIEEFSIKKSFAKSASPTLSWHDMYDDDSDDDSVGIHDSENRYNYYNDSDESDIISDQCRSTDSESDDNFFRYAYEMDDLYEDAGMDVDDWYDADMYDGYY